MTKVPCKSCQTVRRKMATSCSHSVKQYFPYYLQSLLFRLNSIIFEMILCLGAILGQPSVLSDQLSDEQSCFQSMFSNYFKIQTNSIFVHDINEEYFHVFILNKKLDFPIISYYLYSYWCKCVDSDMKEKEKRNKKGAQNVNMDLVYWSYLCTWNFKSKSLIWRFLPTHHQKPLQGNDLSSSDCLKLFVPDSTSITLTLAALSTREPRNNNFQLRNQKKTWGFDLWCMTNYQIAGLMKIKLLVTTKI